MLAQWTALLTKLKILIINGASDWRVNWGCDLADTYCMSNGQPHKNPIRVAWNEAIVELQRLRTEATEILGRPMNGLSIAHILLAIAQAGCPRNGMRERRNNLVKQLLDWGANRTLRDGQNYTALMHAASNNDNDLYPALSDYHVSVSMRDGEGKTASDMKNPGSKQMMTFICLNNDNAVQDDIDERFKRQKTI